MKKWEISRRLLLRGAGAAVALPLLEQMMPSVARAQAASPAPRRLVAFHVPYGMNMATWTPATTGSGYALTGALTPLAPVKSKVSVISGLANRAGYAVGTPGEHPCGMGAFLTASRPTLGSTLGNGISVDQAAANHLKQFTRIPSLQLGPHELSNGGDCQGYSCVYMTNISWVNSTTPATRDVDPSAVFNRLMSVGGPQTETDAEAAKRKKQRLSLLDSVKSDTSKLQGKLGTADKRKVDQYLTGVRELELRVNAIEVTKTRPACAVGTAPAAGMQNWDFDKFPAYHQAMLDLIALAFQCDLTRVATYLPYAPYPSAYAYSWLGIPDGHHDLSHLQGVNPAEKLTAIDRWLVEQFVKFLQKLDAMVEPDGTVLENSMIMYSSEVGSGAAHNHDNLPVLLAGTGGGKFTSGRHVSFPTEEPVANLYLRMLTAVGAPATSFGMDSTRVLPL